MRRALKIMDRYQPNSRFKPDPERPEVCQNCRAGFHDHYNGHCPVDENEEKAAALSHVYEDGEVIGLDDDGCVIQWDAKQQQPYNCGETPEQFGLDSLTLAERQRIGPITGMMEG